VQQLWAHLAVVLHLAVDPHLVVLPLLAATQVLLYHQRSAQVEQAAGSQRSTTDLTHHFSFFLKSKILITDLDS
jgi:hypothetical protein